MGLLDVYIDVPISWRNGNYYRAKGYDIPHAYIGIMKIRASDVNHKSKVAKLRFVCDCCGEEFERTAENYYNNLAKNYHETTYCPNCYHIHTQETMEKKYGVKVYTQASDFNEKVRKTSLKKYGVEHYRKDAEVEKKRKQTCMDRYGVDTYRKTPEARKQSKELFHKNGLVSSSKAQRHICDLVGGQLNYKYHGFYLDVFFEGWLDIEYDGSGHDLRVKHGDMTQSQFDAKERKRFASIHSYGCKTLVIKGNPKDLLPSDEELIKSIYEKIEFLRNSTSKTANIDYSKLQ